MLAVILTIVNCQLTTASAQDSVFSYTHQGTTLYYIIDSNQQAMVVPPLYPDYYINPADGVRSTWHGYVKPTGAVTIPDTVSFAGTLYPVTCIGVDAFFHCDSITEAYVPPTVVRLDTGAFCYCSAMQSVELTEGLIYIGDYAFQSTALHSVSVPGTVQRIGLSAFAAIDSLSSVTLNEGLQVIDMGAFMHNPNLTTLNFPSTLTAINAFAFQDDTLLSSDFILPEGVTTLGDAAFDGCFSIQNVYIPGTVDRIGADAFSRCRSLQSVTLDSGVSVIGNFAFNQFMFSATMLGQTIGSSGHADSEINIGGGLIMLDCYLDSTLLTRNIHVAKINVKLHDTIQSFYIGMRGDSICTSPQERGYEALVKTHSNGEQRLYDACFEIYTNLDKIAKRNGGAGRNIGKEDFYDFWIALPSYEETLSQTGYSSVLNTRY